MATTLNRGSTWTNSDGLVVGFGPNEANFNGAVEKNQGSGPKTSNVVFTWENFNAGDAVNVPIPAGSRIQNVKVHIDETFTSTGTNTAEVGDGSDPNGFITTTKLTVANMTAGAILNGDGVYLYGATDTDGREFKEYTSADTVDLVSAQTDWTAGRATLVVTFA